MQQLLGINGKPMTRALRRRAAAREKARVRGTFGGVQEHIRTASGLDSCAVNITPRDEILALAAPSIPRIVGRRANTQQPASGRLDGSPRYRVKGRERLTRQEIAALLDESEVA